MYMVRVICSIIFLILINCYSLEQLLVICLSLGVEFLFSYFFLDKLGAERCEDWQ